MCFNSYQHTGHDDGNDVLHDGLVVHDTHRGDTNTALSGTVGGAQVWRKTNNKRENGENMQEKGRNREGRWRRDSETHRYVLFICMHVFLVCVFY